MNPKKILVIALVISIISGFVGGLIGSQFSKTSPKVKPEEPSPKIVERPVLSEEEVIINVVKKVTPSVVSIVLTKDVPIFKERWFSPFEFFPEFQIPELQQEGTEKRKIGGGSGFIVSSDGLILTNYHVVEEENVDYTVILSNGKEYKAKILARDQVYDLAILKIEEKSLQPLPLGDSDKLEVGQKVIAIGYALGELPNTVSLGIISGLKRDIVAQGSSGRVERIKEAIQTDAAINLGNSGGPLLNLKGEVIGINVAMAPEAQNIGFAIPINRAKKVIEEVKKEGKIRYPFLGIIWQQIDEELASKYNLPVNYGALIVRDEKGIAIVPGSPADKAGLQENDIILEINGQKLTKENPLNEVIYKYKPGDTILLKILRKGKEKLVPVTLGER